MHVSPIGPDGEPLTPGEVWNRKAAEWYRWHKANPMIWQYFERFMFEAIRAGKKKTSHWLIIGRIRWEVYIVTTPRESGEDFKISNDFIAFYARWWKKQYPMHADMLKTKRMIGEDPASPYIG